VAVCDGTFSGLVTWPVAPVKGVITLSNAIREQAEEQRRSPATIRKKLEALEELPEEEQQAQMEQLTQEWMKSQ
jgi:5,10-methylenetetrahydrofolate reductase